MSKIVERKAERMLFTELVNRVRNMTLTICQENPIIQRTFWSPLQVNSPETGVIGVSFKPVGLELCQGVPELRLNVIQDYASKLPSCKIRATFLSYTNTELDNMVMAQWEIDRLPIEGNNYDVAWASAGLSLMHWIIGTIDAIKEITKKHAYNNGEKAEQSGSGAVDGDKA